jgi:LacI family transcriptional regulator, galactose operon repressor
MAPPQRANVKDVAARAGVSVGTVSNVLNRPDVVSKATLNKVKAAMSELNFHRNASARHLRAGVSSTVGVVVQDIRNPFYTELARGIEDRLTEDDQSLIICSSDSDPLREARCLRMLAEQGVRGVLITPTSVGTRNLTSLTDMGISWVLMDTDLPGQPCVSVDNVLGGYLAVAHLLERGHRRIGVIAGIKGLQTSDQRCEGAVKAVVEAGLDPTKVLQITQLNEHNANAGQAATRELLDAANPPTAIFTINDIVALGVLREARARGIDVPQQLAVVGYDDIFLAQELMVPLSSVRQPMWGLGWAAADMLLDDTDHPPFTPDLIVRASSDHQRS